MYLVMEIMTGGELFDWIVEKEAYTEAEAVETIRPIIDALHYCHEMGIIHRDLKPENLLYETKDDGSIVKIGDFGLARFVTPGSYATTACGTPGYVAPEIIRGEKYGKEVDFGVLELSFTSFCVDSHRFTMMIMQLCSKQLKSVSTLSLHHIGTTFQKKRRIVFKDCFK